MFNVIAYRCSKDCDHAKRGIDCREKTEKIVKNMERNLPLMPGWERAADYHCEKLVSKREWHNRAKPARHQPVNPDAAQVRVILSVYFVYFQMRISVIIVFALVPVYYVFVFISMSNINLLTMMLLRSLISLSLLLPARCFAIPSWFLVKWKASGTWIYF